MINCEKELIRICPTDAEKLEYSTNDGHSWRTRYSGGVDEFSDLTENGDEIIKLSVYVYRFYLASLIRRIIKYKYFYQINARLINGNFF